MSDEKNYAKKLEKLKEREKSLERRYNRVYRYEKEANAGIRRAAEDAAKKAGEAAVLRAQLSAVHDDYRDQMSGMRRKVKKQSDEINRLRTIIEKGFHDAP